MLAVYGVGLLGFFWLSMDRLGLIGGLLLIDLAFLFLATALVWTSECLTGAAAEEMLQGPVFRRAAGPIRLPSSRFHPLLALSWTQDRTSACASVIFILIWTPLSAMVLSLFPGTILIWLPFTPTLLVLASPEYPISPERRKAEGLYAWGLDLGRQDQIRCRFWIAVSSLLVLAAFGLRAGFGGNPLLTEAAVAAAAWSVLVFLLISILGRFLIGCPPLVLGLLLWLAGGEALKEFFAGMAGLPPLAQLGLSLALAAIALIAFRAALRRASDEGKLKEKRFDPSN